MVEREDGRITFSTDEADIGQVAQHIADLVQRARPDDEVKVIKDEKNKFLVEYADDRIVIRYNAKDGTTVKYRWSESDVVDIIDRRGPDLVTNGSPTERKETRKTKDDKGNTKAEVRPDGMTCFEPPFTKEEANYKEEKDDILDSRECLYCVHYLEEGGCRMVKGEVGETDYCERFYSDMGFFARSTMGSEAELTMTMWGELYNVEREDAETILKRIRSKLETVVEEEED